MHKAVGGMQIGGMQKYSSRQRSSNALYDLYSCLMCVCAAEVLINSNNASTDNSWLDRASRQISSNALMIYIA
jgi:hypothetical protein